MQTSSFSLSPLTRWVLASTANLCLNHWGLYMVIFPILSFHLLPGTPLERKKIPPPIFDFDYHFELMDSKNIFNVLIIYGSRYAFKTH